MKAESATDFTNKIHFNTQVCPMLRRIGVSLGPCNGGEPAVEVDAAGVPCFTSPPSATHKSLHRPWEMQSELFLARVDLGLKTDELRTERGHGKNYRILRGDSRFLFFYA